MIVYLGTILIILISGFFYSSREAKTKRSYRSQYIIGVSILLILQSGLRHWAVGQDTYAYFEIFEREKAYPWPFIQELVKEYYLFGTGKDPGYVVFEKLAQYLLPHYQLFLILIATIFFSALGNFIYRNTTRLSDAVLAYVLYSCLFFSFFSVTGNRQTIATAAALYGWELIKKRKLFLFLFLIMLASSIHKSVLVFIPLYFITALKNSKLYFVLVLLVFPVFMVYKMTFYDVIQEMSGYERYELWENAGTYIFTAMLLVVAVVALWRMKTVMRLNEGSSQIYNGFILAVFFTPLTWINPSTMRAVQYFSLFMLVLLPMVVNSFQVESRKLRKMAYILSICVLLILFIRANIGIEYKFFWQPMELGENYR